MKRKMIIILLVTLILAGLAGCTKGHSQENHGGSMSNFNAEKNEFSEIMIINAPIDKVFPLLCPVREHDWIPTWNADILWSVSGLAEEGAVFKTGNETWIITDYVPMKTVNFVRYNPDVVTRLKIEVSEKHGKTQMLWTQSQVGTTESGNIEVAEQKADGFSGMVKSLEAMMTYYLMSGNMIDDSTLKKHLGTSSH